MKTAKTFRLSQQALAALDNIAQKTGASETAILELSLILFQQEVERSFLRSENGDIPTSRQTTNNLPTGKKHRKRHR